MYPLGRYSPRHERLVCVDLASRRHKKNPPCGGSVVYQGRIMAYAMTISAPISEMIGPGIRRVLPALNLL